MLFWAMEAPEQKKTRADRAESANKRRKALCGPIVSGLDAGPGFSINLSTRPVSMWGDSFHESGFKKTPTPTNLIIQAKVEAHCLQQ